MGALGKVKPSMKAVMDVVSRTLLKFESRIFLRFMPVILNKLT